MKASDIDERELLQMIAEHEAGRLPYDVLVSRGIPEKVVYAKYEKLDRRGLIEYGVSLRTAWLTAAGAARLQS